MSIKYFEEVKTKNELKSTYRRLSVIHHPDKGGEVKIMQQLNHEYSLMKNTFGIVPEKLEKAQIGNFIFVSKSTCMVTNIEGNLIKAKSLITKREAFFDKKTGYGLFNFNLKAHVNEYKN